MTTKLARDLVVEAPRVLGDLHLTVEPGWPLNAEGERLKADAERRYEAGEITDTLHDWWFMWDYAGKLPDEDGEPVFSNANRKLRSAGGFRTSAVQLYTDRWALTLSGSLYRLGRPSTFETRTS